MTASDTYCFELCFFWLVFSFKVFELIFTRQHMLVQVRRRTVCSESGRNRNRVLLAESRGKQELGEGLGWLLKTQWLSWRGSADRSINILMAALKSPTQHVCFSLSWPYWWGPHFPADESPKYQQKHLNCGKCRPKICWGECYNHRTNHADGNQPLDHS